MKLKFGDKVKFTCEVHESLEDVEFCLLGMCKTAVALIEWENRGGYGFHYISCKPEKDLMKVN